MGGTGQPTIGGGRSTGEGVLGGAGCGGNAARGQWGGALRGALGLAEAEAAQDVPQPRHLQHADQLPVAVLAHRVQVVPDSALRNACRVLQLPYVSCQSPVQANHA